jgi:hypothetical protein
MKAPISPGFGTRARPRVKITSATRCAACNSIFRIPTAEDKSVRRPPPPWSSKLAGMRQLDMAAGQQDDVLHQESDFLRHRWEAVGRCRPALRHKRTDRCGTDEPKFPPSAKDSPRFVPETYEYRLAWPRIVPSSINSLMETHCAKSAPLSFFPSATNPPNFYFGFMMNTRSGFGRNATKKVGRLQAIV